eukprot:scaffold14885_cov76-Skeletonema_menzelii.AAC.2
MPPSIDGNESPGPSRGQGAGAGCDGSTTEFTAERMAENSLKGMKLGLRKCSLLSIHLLALVFEVLIRRVDFHLPRASSCISGLLLVIECNSVTKLLSSLNQSNESALSNEDFKLMDIDIAGRVHLAYDIRLAL